ncbi:hypothetical protein [Cellulomonas sp. KH9]|uniref:hypothetical protein n=1 Tax=Cellulomonas sp. KH9 TaxID=1855324 RepID=UPI0008F3BE99|nr:hypothetical protein [Cellulomonas sp. KH9]SFJ82223.1 hypothetical protein SAMN05216467_1141 [Cellulomonas sp. KH9]
MRVWGATAAVVAVLAVSACSGDEPADGAAPSAQPTAWDITATEGVDGASRQVVDGIGVDVPADFTADERTAADDTTQLVLQRDGATRSEVNVTVTREEDVDDAAVDAAAATAFAQLGATGSASDLVRETLTWEGFGHAVAVQGVLTLEDGTELDVEYVTTRDPQGTRLVAVWTEAPRGELDGSVAHEVLRTVRVDG